MSCTRLCLLFFAVSTALFVPLAGAVNIPVEHLDPASAPCGLTVTENGSTRTLQWSLVSGATSYKVGYRRCNGEVVGLAELPFTSYDHVGWTGECLDYVVVAYDAKGCKVCAAVVENFGGCNCP